MIEQSIAIHQQEGYPWGKQARIAGPIPNSERNAACCISLPMFAELTEEQLVQIADAVRTCVRRLAGS